MRVRCALAVSLMAAAVCMVSTDAHALQAKTQAKAQAKTQPKTSPADQVVATVNGEKLTRRQVADEVLADQASRLKATNPQFADRARPVAASIGALVMKRMEASKGKPVSVTRAEIVNWLIDEKSPVIRDAVQGRIREMAIVQYGKKRGVKLTDAEVAKQTAKSIDNARTQLRLQGKSDAQVLKELGYRPETIKRGVIASLYLEHLVRMELEQKIGHTLGPDDYREGRHILIRANTQPPAGQPAGDAAAPDPDPEKAYAEAKAKIDAVAQEIENKSKTFEKAAMDSSDDPSKFQEGKLGVFVRGQMVPEFEAVAFSLPVGVVSQPVRSQFGWHLIRIDRLGKDVTEAERDQAWQNYVRSRAQGLVSQIMSEAKVVNKVGAPEPAGFPGMR